MDDLQILNCPGFIILIPATWTSSLDINDPETIVVTIDETDSFSINTGNKSKTITNFQNIIVEDVTIQEIVDEENGGEIIEETTIVKTQTLHSDIYPDIIADCEVRCLIPREPGHGATGVFFETLNPLNKTTSLISFLAFHLKPQNKKLFLSAIRTLRFDATNSNN